MKIVIGGAYQGKLDYAKKMYGLTDGWADGRTCLPEEIGVCRGIHHFHIYVKRLLDENGEIIFPGSCSKDGSGNGSAPARADDSASMRVPEETADRSVPAGADLSRLERQAEAFAKELFRRNPEIVVVTNELGYGIVPMEKADRLWREADGRICTCLAACADEVVRVVCGIGMRLK